MKVETRQVIPVINLDVRKLCFKPYYSHPRGCPNYNKREICPPQCPLWYDVFIKGARTDVYWTKFDLGNHRENMRKKHPKWSRRQLDCCLYWQGKALKPLKDYIKYTWQPVGYEIKLRPEAYGIDITATMKSIGIELEWPPDKWTYQVAIGGWLC